MSSAAVPPSAVSGAISMPPAVAVDPAVGAALIGAAGTAQFGPALLAATGGAGEVAEVFAYRLGFGENPRTLLSYGILGGIEQRTRLYARSFHAHDPAAFSAATAAGGFSCRVSAAEILRQDYRELCFERPRFVDKLCFGWRTEADLTVISFYRRQGAAAGDALLAALASIGLSVLRHISRPVSQVDGIEQRIAMLFPQLTRREREVCARSIAGWSAREIAAALRVTRATVLTYRQRAYQRLGFSKAADFLDRLMH